MYLHPVRVVLGLLWWHGRIFFQHTLISNRIYSQTKKQTGSNMATSPGDPKRGSLFRAKKKKTTTTTTTNGVAYTYEQSPLCITLVLETKTNKNESADKWRSSSLTCRVLQTSAAMETSPQTYKCAPWLRILSQMSNASCFNKSWTYFCWRKKSICE